MVCVAIGWYGLHSCTGAESCPWLTPWKEKTMWRTKEMRLTGSWKPDEGGLHHIYKGEPLCPSCGVSTVPYTLRLALLRQVII